MAAWSFPKKGDAVESVARPLLVESLDGRRVRGRLTVRFDRPLAVDVGERLAADIMSAIAAVMSEEICEDTVPFTAEELAAKVNGRPRAVGARVSSFTISALELADAQANAHRSYAPPRSAAPSPRSIAPSPRSIAPPAAYDAPSRPSSASGVMPAVVPSNRAPAAHSTRPPGDANHGAVRTLWQRPVGASLSGESAPRVGHLFAPALRDSTAAAVFILLGAVDPAAIDRLELLEGRANSPILPHLRREACACLAAAFYRILAGAAVDHATAREIAEWACGEALAPDPLPRAEVERYLGSNAPLRDLAHVAAAALGAPEDAGRLFVALSSYGSALRVDLGTAAANVKRLLGVA